MKHKDLSEKEMKIRAFNELFIQTARTKELKELISEATDFAMMPQERFERFTEQLMQNAKERSVEQEAGWFISLCKLDREIANVSTKQM